MIKIIEELKKKFQDKKVLIVGLGLQGGGAGLAEFFAKLGANVKVTDKKTKNQLIQSIKRLDKYHIEFTLEKHELTDFLEADIVFKGPSVPWDLPEIKKAEEKGIPIEIETSFFASLCPAQIIGITGTRGKSTVTMMIYQILKNYLDKKIHLAGNLPQTSTINLLPSININDLVILELSSWQLSGFHRKKISPHIAVFTNLYPDHLNLYPSMNEYLYDKKAIYLYQKKGDYLVANKNLEQIIKKDAVSSKILFFSALGFTNNLLHLKGVHNLENAAAALKVGEILGLDLNLCISTIGNFKTLPYRQEIIREKDGIIFINDTTSTTPIAAEKAIDTFSDKPIVLILGGNSKNLPLGQLIDRLNKVVKIILLKGSFTDEIIRELNAKYKNKVIQQYDNLEPAVRRAFEEAKKSGKAYVLFSPGATSFAMFNNEFHRGDEFNRIVKHL